MTISKQNRTAFKLLALSLFMLAGAFAAVPFYDWFCRVTGFSGTTQTAETQSEVVTNVPMTIRFSANTMRDMPWEFRPLTTNVKVNIGETNLVYYEAYNPTDEVITGSASFNVSPLELGGYFSKIECFCFTEQTLQPKERIEMPVSFYVDPEILDDPDTKDIKELTLAYTFHLTERKSVN